MDQGRKAWGQKSLFGFALVVVCVLLVVWKADRSFKVRAGRVWRSALPETGNTRTNLTTAASKPAEVYVLGKLVERRPTKGGIFVSIKTTLENHKTRVAPSILTWLQTVKPEQVSSAFPPPSTHTHTKHIICPIPYVL